MGTAAGSRIFLQFGWRAAAAFALGLYGFQIVLLLVRGPHCRRYTWVGYEGGLGARKTVLSSAAPTPPEVKVTSTAATVDEKTNMSPPSTEELKVDNASGAASVVSEQPLAWESV